ncbi:MAG: hypothetical protein ACOX8U_12025 [Bradymonadia bacterium]
MKKWILGIIVFWLTAATLTYFMLKPKPESFADNPFSHQNIATLCEKQDFEPLKLQFLTLSNEEKIRFLAIVYQYGCLESSGLDAAALYAELAPTLLHSSTEYLEELVQYALKSVEDPASTDAQLAARYLTKFYEKLDEDSLDRIFEAMKARDAQSMIDVFLSIKTPKMLEYLENIELTAESRDAFLKHWPIFSNARQAELLSEIVNARWFMQASGSSQLPQYLGLLVQRFEAPEMEDFVMRVFVESVSVNGRKLRRHGEALAKNFEIAAFKKADAAYILEDLQPWLTVADWVRINAKAELVLFRADAPAQCYGLTADAAPNVVAPNSDEEELEQAEGEDEKSELEGEGAEEAPTELSLGELCQNAVIHRHPVVRDFSYRVFQGVETGSPRRSRDESKNKESATKLVISLCNSEQCVELWSGKQDKTPQKLSVDYSKDLYLRITSSDKMENAFAARLVARTASMPNAVWEEVASAFSHSTMSEALPLRAELNVQKLCPSTGTCALSFQLRPSLRMARKDPRIANYQGATIDLRPVNLEIKTAANSKVWEEFFSGI